IITILDILYIVLFLISYIYFFFNDTSTTDIYTLSLHDALPISIIVGFTTCNRVSDITACSTARDSSRRSCPASMISCCRQPIRRDRKSTRLNSSHSQISYAVFCLKKKKKLNERID